METPGRPTRCTGRRTVTWPGWMLLGLVLSGGAQAAESWPDIDAPLKTGATAVADAAVVIGNEVYPSYPNRDSTVHQEEGLPADR